MTFPEIKTLSDVEALYEGGEKEMNMETRFRYSDDRGIVHDDALSEIIWQNNMVRIENFCIRHIERHPGCTYAEALKICWRGNPEYLRIYTRTEKGAM